MDIRELIEKIGSVLSYSHHLIRQDGKPIIHTRGRCGGSKSTNLYHA